MDQFTRAITVAIVAVSCGGPTAPPAPVGAPASLIATAASANDAVVAQINGRPVWASCVTAQAERAQRSRDAALAECIDFELLAQTAEQRGLATNGDVVAKTKTAMVNRVIASMYEDGFTRPEQFGSAWDRILAKTKLASRWKHVEYRASSYVRVDLDPKATKEQDDHARAVAEKVAAALVGERGLLGPQLVAIAEPIAGDVKLSHEEVPLFRVGALDPPYADALFAIPEIGRASPAVRTKFGWDVIVWTGVEPETSPSPDELVAKLLPDVKQLYFNTWVETVAQRLGLHVELIQANIDKLEALP